MEITYLGQSSCKLKTKTGTLVVEPYGKSSGGKMPSVVGDLVLFSGQMEDKAERVASVTKTSRRKAPFVIDEPGEYEIEEISVFGYASGEDVLYLVHAEELRVLQITALEKMISGKLLEKLEGVDVLIMPIGVDSKISPLLAAELANKLEVSYVVVLASENNSPEMKKFLEGYSKTVREVKAFSVTKSGIVGEVAEVITFI